MLRTGSVPLAIFRNELGIAKAHLNSAFAGIWSRLADGPGPYEGMWELIRLCYDALRRGEAAPLKPADLAETYFAIERLIEGAPQRNNQQARQC